MIRRVDTLRIDTPPARAGHSTKRLQGGPLPDKQAYTTAEVGRMMGLSTRTVIRLFEQESGVLILERPETMHKRRYRSIRIPRAVYERVSRKLVVR